MKATGIVRRIDDLGRVVIPKEIRRTLRIREGDSLEIFVDREGLVILKKYSPISEISHYTKELSESIHASLQKPVLICDRDEVVAAVGLSRKDYLNKRFSSIIEEVMEKRDPILINDQAEEVTFVEGASEVVSSYTISPIIASGDPVGAVVIFTSEGKLSEVEEIVAETAAGFLGRKIEQ